MPERKMSSHMKVEMKMEGEKRVFTLKLSRANLNFLLADCPELGCLVGHYHDACFKLFNDINGDARPDSFRAFSDGEYHADIGLPEPPPSPNLPKEEYDRQDRLLEKKMIDAINWGGRIPMELGEQFGNANVGYVEIRVEEA
jgi:hypothetical protein